MLWECCSLLLTRIYVAGNTPIYHSCCRSPLRRFLLLCSIFSCCTVLVACGYAVALVTGRINGTNYQWLVPTKVKERLSLFDGLGCCSRRQYMWPCKKAGCDTTTSSPTLFFGLFCLFRSGLAYPAQPCFHLFICLFVY